MKFPKILLLAACSVPLVVGAAPTVPFDLGLPSFEFLLRALPKWGDNLVEVSVAKEKYGVVRNDEAKNKPPQIYSSPVLIPAAWPKELKREGLEAVFSLTVLPDGSTKDVRRLSALHEDLERVATVYLSRLRYSPAEVGGNPVATQAEVIVRFQTDGFFPE